MSRVVGFTVCYHRLTTLYLCVCASMHRLTTLYPFRSYFGSSRKGAMWVCCNDKVPPEDVKGVVRSTQEAGGTGGLLKDAEVKAPDLVSTLPWNAGDGHSLRKI